MEINIEVLCCQVLLSIICTRGGEVHDEEEGWLALFRGVFPPPHTLGYARIAPACALR